MAKTKTIWTATQYLDLLRAKATRAVYRVSVKQFLGLFYPETEIPKGNPAEADKILDELSVRYITEDRDHDKDAQAFSKFLEDYAPKTRRQKFGTFKAFLEVNDIQINNGILRLITGGASEAVSEERVPTKVEIASILKHLPLHSRSIALTILSSGLRPGEAFGLTFDNLDMEADPAKITLKGWQTKTGKGRWTYISPQAKAEIESWLSYRDQFIENNLKFVPADNKEKYLKTRENLIYPVSYSAFLGTWVRALKKVGLYEQDKDTNRVTLRPHNLRKFFATHGSFKDRDVAEFFLGHINALKAVYHRYDQVEEKVRDEYIQAIPSLTIGSFGDVNAGVVEELTSRINDFRDDKEEVSDNVNYVLKQNRALSNEVDELRAKVNGLESEIQHIVKWMEQEINSRAALLSGGTDETIHATEEEALADLQEKKRVKNR